MNICVVSAKKRVSQKYRYCKHLCRIDRPSKLVISDYDICTFARVVIPSTYPYFGDFADTIMISKVLGGWFFAYYLNISLPTTIKRSCQTISNFYKPKALLARTRFFLSIKICNHYSINLTGRAFALPVLFCFLIFK